MTLLRYLLRNLAIGVTLCTFIALFLSTAFNDPLGRTLVFSYCVGLSCQFLIDGGRRGLVHLLRLRHAENAALKPGWPGWTWTLAIVGFGVWGGIVGGYAPAGRILGIDAPLPGLDNLRSMFIIVSVSLVASLGYTALSWARARMALAEANTQRAQRAAAENQLKLLESQLEPHMLFNTLANLRVLIALDPPRAQAMLDRLIAFLRATLDASRAELAAARDGAALVLTVRDSGVGLSNANAVQGTRFGLQQVRDRLASLYGASASFTLDDAPGGGSVARVTIPLVAR